MYNVEMVCVCVGGELFLYLLPDPTVSLFRNIRRALMGQAKCPSRQASVSQSGPTDASVTILGNNEPCILV